MPEGYKKPKWRLRPQWGLSHVAALGNLLKVQCRRCRRTRYFLATDLLAVFGDHEIDDITFGCPICGTSNYVLISQHTPQPGDWGSLPVRRPTEPIAVIKWRTVKLGDP